MKKSIKLIAMLLATEIILLSVSSCVSVLASDSPYMSKGEFISLFVSETSLYPSNNSNVEINLDSNNRYYDPAISLVEIGYLSAEDAISDLDVAVTKEFVAVLCVKNLYFREKFENITLKDANELSDFEACRDAVGHGIVTDENGYFVAYRKMTYTECQAAIDRMMNIDASGSYIGNEAEINVELKENVINITDGLTDEDIDFIDPSDPEVNELLTGMSYDNEDMLYTSIKEDRIPLSCSTDVSQQIDTNNVDIALNSSNIGAICPIDEADVGDSVIVKIAKGATRRYEVGNMIIYGLYQTETFGLNSGSQKGFFGEVLAVNDPAPASNVGYIYYVIRIPDEKEVINSAKLNQYNSKANNVEWNGEKIPIDKEKNPGILLNNFTINDDGLTFSISKKLQNSIDSWRDSQFTLDMSYTFEIKDISIDVNNFGGILTGDLDGAMCKLNYTVLNTFEASSDVRLTPDDNRNGKFLSNLSRSRFTGHDAAGASEIKIAKLYVDIGYGFNVEVYVYLTIQIDGTIKVNLETQYGKGFRIIQNDNYTKVEPISEKSNKLTMELNVNAEATLHCDLSLRWLRRSGSPWLDLKLEVGIGFECISKVFVLDESHEHCSSVNYGYVSAEELREGEKFESIEYCFDGNFYIFYQISGLTNQSKIGKVIRWFDNDFNLSTGKNKYELMKWHFEDGKNTSNCTRNYGESDEIKVNKINEFVLSEYKLSLNKGDTGVLTITEMPQELNKLYELMGGVTVKSKNPDVAIACIALNVIVVGAQEEGSTELIIESRNKRFIQECSITVSRN